jgi:competence protein ComEA
MFRTLLSLAVVAFLATVVPAAGQASDAKATRSGPKATQVVNLNSATLADLQSLPGIGARTAERIIEYRQKNGPFKKIEELMNVRGIGEKNFLKLKDQITVAAAKDRGPSEN